MSSPEARCEFIAPDGSAHSGLRCERELGHDGRHQTSRTVDTAAEEANAIIYQAMKDEVVKAAKAWEAAHWHETRHTTEKAVSLTMLFSAVQTLLKFEAEQSGKDK